MSKTKFVTIYSIWMALTSKGWELTVYERSYKEGEKCYNRPGKRINKEEVGVISQGRVTDHWERISCHVTCFPDQYDDYIAKMKTKIQEAALYINEGFTKVMENLTNYTPVCKHEKINDWDGR